MCEVPGERGRPARLDECGPAADRPFRAFGPCGRDARAPPGGGPCKGRHDLADARPSGLPARSPGRPPGPSSPGGLARARSASGFTLLELLVVLVLVGLVTTLALPNLERLRGAVASKTERDHILDQFAGLGREAMLQQRAWVVYGSVQALDGTFPGTVAETAGRRLEGSLPGGSGTRPDLIPIRVTSATSSTSRKAGRSGSTSPSSCTRTESASVPGSPCITGEWRTCGWSSSRRTAASPPMRRDEGCGIGLPGPVGPCAVGPRRSGAEPGIRAGACVPPAKRVARADDARTGPRRPVAIGADRRRSPAAFHSRGFTLLETMVALVIFAGAAMALYALFNTNLIALARAHDVSRQVPAVRHAIEHLASINPREENHGTFEVDGLNVAWTATLLRPPRQSRTSAGGIGLFEVGLYEIEFTLSDRNRALGTWRMRSVGYEKVREPLT